MYVHFGAEQGETMVFWRNENAVSPVIGAILMVMISVVLAGVIGTSVFGMAETVQHKRIVAVSVTQSNSDIHIVFGGGQAQPDLHYMTITAPDGTIYVTVTTGGALSTTGTPKTPNVGSVMVLSGAGTTGKDHVVVVGYFYDGSSQVISDVTV